MRQALKLNDGAELWEALTCMADILYAYAKEDTPLSNQEMRRLAAMLDGLAVKTRELSGKKQMPAAISRQDLPWSGNVVLFPVRPRQTQAGERL